MDRQNRPSVGPSIAALGCLLLAACSPGTIPTPTPTPQPTAAQSATPGTSLTGAPTPTEAPTATPVLTLAPTVAPSATQSPVAGGGATAVSVGWYHTCVLVGGGVKCWGHNGAGQLGDGLDVPLPDCIPSCDTDILPGETVPLPQDVTGLQGEATSVSAGGYHTCAVTTDRGAVCWGYNFDAQLGDGTQPCGSGCEGGFGGPFISTPLDVVGLRSGIDSIAAAGSHTCALGSAGGVQCWGTNNSGELGDGSTTASATPVAVSDLASGVGALVSGFYDTCVLTNAGGAKCWGVSGFGQLGDGTTDSRSTPVDVTSLASGVTSIATGEYHTCAVDAAGGAKCWGYNIDGQLGDGSMTDSAVPVDVVGLAGGLAGVAAGSSHSCALSAAGAVKCWGANYYHQLGDGTANSSATPVDVVGLPSGVVAIDAGRDSTCALTSAGSVWCWGDNAFGQLGDGTALERPFAVEALLSGKMSTEPQAIAQAFYDWYLTATDSGDRDLHGRADLTPEFIDAYYGEPWPYDPVLCGQDVPEWASAREATVDGVSASMIVTESWSELGTGVPIDLVNGANGWQISAIQCVP